MNTSLEQQVSGKKIRKIKAFIIAGAILLITACVMKHSDNVDRSADQKLLQIADDLMEKSETRFVNGSIFRGIPGYNHKMFDNSFEAEHAWANTIDEWAALIEEINPDELSGSNIGLHSLIKHQLSTLVKNRACSGLTNLSHRSGGWHKLFIRTLSKLPLETAKNKEDFLIRHSKVSAYINTEIDRFNTYLAEGKSSPRFIVENVIEQLEPYIKTPASESIFLKALNNVDDQEFLAKWTSMVNDEIIPSFKRYRDYLSGVYLPKSRTSISLSKVPGGDKCYLAKIAQNTTLDITPQEIEEMGLAFEKESFESFSRLSLKHFNTTDRKEYSKLLKDPKYRFSSREEMLEYARNYIEKAKVLAKKVFNDIPEGEIVVEQIPEDSEKHEANGSYERGDPKKNIPAKFMLNTYKPQSRTKASMGRLVLHEAIPGHHMLALSVMSNENLHPASHMLRTRVYSEGWAIYAEILASEEGLFLSELDELAFYKSNTYSYFRTKIEMNIHMKGWSMEQAVARMMEEGYSKEDAEIVIGRLVIYPGGTMPYLVGSLEIRRLREYAKQKLGTKFDIKAFHDLILIGGSVPLNTLKTKVMKWVESQLLI